MVLSYEFVLIRTYCTDGRKYIYLYQYVHAVKYVCMTTWNSLYLFILLCYIAAINSFKSDRRFKVRRLIEWGRRSRRGWQGCLLVYYSVCVVRKSFADGIVMVQTSSLRLIIVVILNEKNCFTIIVFHNLVL